MIEVLVVVAILALLISILLPSMKRAREQAQILVCKTRLRELYNGHVYYAHDSRNHFPHWDWWLWDGENSSTNPERQVKFWPNLYAKTGGVRPPNSAQWLRFGHIFKYVKNPAVYLCPKDNLQRTANSIKPAIHSYVRYFEVNSYYHAHLTGNANANVRDGNLTVADFVGPDQLRPRVFEPAVPATPPWGPYTSVPNRVGLLYEEHQGTFTEGDPFAPSGTKYALNDGFSGFDYFKDYISARHLGRAHIIYFDGHTDLVDSKRYNLYYNPSATEQQDLKYLPSVAVGGPK